jgi:hypothetical protein
VAVNHHAAGSSPAPGAKNDKNQDDLLVFYFLHELQGIALSQQTAGRHYCGCIDAFDRRLREYSDPESREQDGKTISGSVARDTA